MMKQTADIAERSGAFDKPKIAALLNGMELTPWQINRVYVAYPVPRETMALGYLRFTVGNSGQKSLKEFQATFRYTEDFSRDVLQKYGTLTSSGSITRHSLQIDTSRNGKLFFVSYALPKLNPSQGANIDEPIFLKPTIFEDTIVDKRLMVQVRYQAEFPRRFELSVGGEDVPLVTYPIEVHVLLAKSATHLQESFIQHERSIAQGYRQAMGFRKYLGLLMQDTDQKAVLQFPLLKPTAVGTDTVWISLGAGADTMMTASYDPIRWELLF
jgi:hypothetical protein